MSVLGRPRWIWLTCIGVAIGATRVAADDCVDALLALPKTKVTFTTPDEIEPFYREIYRSPKFRIIKQTLENGTPHRYEVTDLFSASTDMDYFKIEAKLFEGTLSFHIRTKDKDGRRSQLLRGRDLFDRMMVFFGPALKDIRVQWDYGDNLKTVNQLISQGFSVREAAAGTWSARQAARYGFDHIHVITCIGDPVCRFVIARLTREILAEANFPE